MTGVLKIKTTKEFGESTVSKILDLVENASSQKSKSRILFPDLQKSIHRLYATAHWRWLSSPLVRMLFMGLSADWGTWVYRALTFLIISLSMRACYQYSSQFLCRNRKSTSQAGILVKGSNYLETLSKVRTCL